MEPNVKDIDDTVKLYFNSLKDYKPLSKKEEHELLRRYKIQNDIEARNKLIKSNLKYACQLASSYRNRGVGFSDLISEANDGLLEAIDKFDLRRDVKLISYSKWWIMQRMQSAIDKRQRMPESDIPEDTDSKDAVKDSEETVALSLPISPKDNTFIIDTELEEEKKDTKDYVENLMEGLSDREFTMVNMYFGRNTVEEYTLEDIGKMHGLTKERVRQIIEKALTKMRSKAMLSDNVYLSK